MFFFIATVTEDLEIETTRDLLQGKTFKPPLLFSYPIITSLFEIIGGGSWSGGGGGVLCHPPARGKINKILKA